jgi:hypothetical protein
MTILSQLDEPNGDSKLSVVQGVTGRLICQCPNILQCVDLQLGAGEKGHGVPARNVSSSTGIRHLKQALVVGLNKRWRSTR